MSPRGFFQLSCGHKNKMGNSCPGAAVAYPWGEWGSRPPLFKKMVLEIFPKSNNIGTLEGIEQIQGILTSLKDV